MGSTAAGGSGYFKRVGDYYKRVGGYFKSVRILVARKINVARIFSADKRRSFTANGISRKANIRQIIASILIISF